jgi:hypothetical protein
MTEAELVEGWQEAVIAWAVCASIHRQFCKGRDPFFRTRQSDFVKHEKAAREKFASLMGKQREPDGR